MNYKRRIGFLLAAGILLFGGLASYGAPSGGGGPGGEKQYLAVILPGIGEPAAISQAEGGGEEFEAIRQAADDYVNSGRPLYLTARQLHDSIVSSIPSNYKDIEYDPATFTEAPFILDVRGADSEMPDVYLAGHIPGAIRIPRQLVSQWVTHWKNSEDMPKERQMAVISSTGEVGAMVTAVLNLMGYNAVNLMWGMTSWTADAEVAPGQYNKARDSVTDWGDDFCVDCSTPPPTETYDLPVVENTDAKDKASMITAAADAYLVNGGKRFDMTSAELYRALNYQPLTPAQVFQSMLLTGKANGNPYPVPFILDIRDNPAYLKGHLNGSLHILWKELFKTDNLTKLPANRQVLVYGDTEAESGVITALLNMLGYNAVNLRWGIAADQFVPARDCMNYPTVAGFGSYKPWQPPPTGP